MEREPDRASEELAGLQRNLQLYRSLGAPEAVQATETRIQALFRPFDRDRYMTRAAVIGAELHSPDESRFAEALKQARELATEYTPCLFRGIAVNLKNEAEELSHSRWQNRMILKAFEAAAVTQVEALYRKELPDSARSLQTELQATLGRISASLQSGKTPLEAVQAERALHPVSRFVDMYYESGLSALIPEISRSNAEISGLLVGYAETLESYGHFSGARNLAEALEASVGAGLHQRAYDLLSRLPDEALTEERYQFLFNLNPLSFTAESNVAVLKTAATAASFVSANALGRLAGLGSSELMVSAGASKIEAGLAAHLANTLTIGATQPLLAPEAEHLTFDSYLAQFAHLGGLTGALRIRGALMGDVSSPFLNYAGTIGTMTAYDYAAQPEIRNLPFALNLAHTVGNDLLMRSGELLFEARAKISIPELRLPKIEAGAPELSLGLTSALLFLTGCERHGGSAWETLGAWLGVGLGILAMTKSGGSPEARPPIDLLGSLDIGHSEWNIHLRENEDPAAWKAYGEQLTKLRDPRGELIAIETQLETATGENRRTLESRQSELIDLLTGEFRSILGEDLAKGLQKIQWKHGHIEGVEITANHKLILTELMERKELSWILSSLTLRNIGNEIDGILGEFDKSFPGITGLKIKVFTGENLGERISNSLSGSFLRALDLSGARLTSEGIVKLTEAPSLQGLTHLNLSNTRLGTTLTKALINSMSPSDLETLELEASQIRDDMARALANSTNLRGLTTLNLSGNEIGDKAAIALANSANLRNLTGLELANNRIGVEGARALAGSENLLSLTSLELDNNQIGDEGVRALASSTNLTGLSSLYLGNNQISDEGARALASSVNLTGLSTLALGRNQIGDEGARALASSTNLTGLSTLSLRLNQIGDEGVRALASSANLTGLSTLSLNGNEIGDEGVRALASSTNLTGLSTLDLGRNQIGDEGARTLANSINLTSLTSLNLQSTQIGDEGVRALASSTNLTGLSILGLWGNEIGDEGARALASSANLTGLRLLDLDSNEIGDEGARALVSSANLTGLRSLELSNNRIDVEAAVALTRSANLRGLTIAIEMDDF